MSELTVRGNTSNGEFHQDDNSEEYREAFNYKVLFACVVLLVMSLYAVAVFSPELNSALHWIDALIACGSGVVMALVVGRLGSKFIDPGTGVLAILYLYAVIQPLAIYFSEKPNARLYATTAALFLKAFLWLVFYWTFTDGKLWVYVTALRNLLLSARTPPELLGAR